MGYRGLASVVYPDAQAKTSEDWKEKAWNKIQGWGSQAKKYLTDPKYSTDRKDIFNALAGYTSAQQERRKNLAQVQAAAATNAFGNLTGLHATPQIKSSPEKWMTARKFMETGKQGRKEEASRKYKKQEAMALKNLDTLAMIRKSVPEDVYNRKVMDTYNRIQKLNKLIYGE